jgi:hypothetical protein
LRCAICGSHYRGDASNGTRRVRHVARPACVRSLTHRADVIEDQVAALFDSIRLSDADVDAVLSLVKAPAEQTDLPELALDRDHGARISRSN